MTKTVMSHMELNNFMTRLERHLEYLCDKLANVANTDATKFYHVGITIGAINQIIEQERIAQIEEGK